MAGIDSYNKRHKHDHFIAFKIHRTQTLDPILVENDVILQSANQASRGAEGERDHPPGLAIQAPQPRQEQRMPPRPSLPSTQASSLSTPESQSLTVFSLKEKNLDAQSEYSHTTAQSSCTTYPLGGKDCKDCVTNLKKFFSSWKNHYWPVHCPREVYYCFGCKMSLLKDEESGTVSWQCNKVKCLKVFKDDSQAVVHFTDRSLPCYDRFAIFAREKPFRTHLQKEHIRMELLNGTTLHISCNLCDDTFTDWSESSKHKCPKAAGWKYRLTTPVNVTCDWHPDLVLETEKQVNDHFQSEHFGNRRRNNVNGGSNLGDNDSRHDARSVNGNEHQINHPQRLGHLHTGPLGSEALYPSQAELDSQPHYTDADPTIVIHDNELEPDPKTSQPLDPAMEGRYRIITKRISAIEDLGISTPDIP